MLGALVGFVEIILLIYLIAGVLDNFLNLSRDFQTRRVGRDFCEYQKKQTKYYSKDFQIYI